MKKYFLISILIFSAISFTGCGTKNISYEKYSIERDLNSNISKIENCNIVLIDKSKTIITKKPNNNNISFVNFQLEASDINTKISNEFFSQYFLLDNKSKELFTVESQISDFSIMTTGNPNDYRVLLTMDFKVIKNGKVILNKTYTKTAPGIVIWEWRLTPLEITFRKLQKGVLSIYENEFKTDLLKALKENK